MTKVGEHITLDIIGDNKEYDPSLVMINYLYYHLLYLELYVHQL